MAQTSRPIASVLEMYEYTQLSDQIVLRKLIWNKQNL